MDANDMSAAELRALADQKDKEEKDSLNKVIKIGYLKRDLYQVDDQVGGFDFDYGAATKKEIKEITKLMFIKVLPAGTKVECFHYDGEDFWFDTVGYIEEWPDWMAKKWFRGIKKV